MSPCAGLNCTSPAENATPPNHHISIEAEVTISFGIAMVVLAVLALRQGHKQRHRTSGIQRRLHMLVQRAPC